MNRKRTHHLIKESGWTVDDYYQLPEDGNQYEIIEGVLELKPSPSTTHQRISHQLEKRMTDCCEQDYITFDAPIDVILSDNETRQPDILMIHRSREHIIEEHAVVGPPDLVVEILSPNSIKRDRLVKHESYARFGVAEYWIVDPNNLAIEQYLQAEAGQPYRLANVFAEEDQVHSERVPCLSFTVGDVLRIR
ncbi:Uma2 family endonuclease [Bacillus sp. DJP31]|uniref:Uma2 family endonuclease n=1 Tax=Bacillus sp. DJP31 TaxID=3409789 RepID=UPI003BB49CCD